uniref:Transmembrane protein 67 n=1 Tax=Salarias fasciatus TaxID=181472 RepID=A0A672G498_SALFA
NVFDTLPLSKRAFPAFSQFTMATGTLRLAIVTHKVPLQYIIPLKTPLDCQADEFFDISSLSCARCGANQRRSTTGLSCVCQNGYQTLTTDKVSIDCQQCPTDKPGVTKDGFGCIRCPGSLSDDGKCQCPDGNVLVERDINGTFLDEARCEACIGASPAFSVPSSSGNRCERCQASFIDTSCMCNSPHILVNFTEEHHIYLNVHVLQTFSNLTACQALGNMCVMNMHSFSSVSTDACGLFNTIFRSRAALSSTQDISYWRATLPWLYYGDEPGLASRVLQTEPVPIRFSFRGEKKNTDITLLAAVYNVRGEFLRWEPVGESNLQLCPKPATKQAAAFSFGTAYQESVKLFDSHPEPLFYDVFLDLGGEETRQLLPLPTLVRNQQYSGRLINQESIRNWYLSRRMFLIDMLSGREKSISSQPKVIRVASRITIKFQLVPRTQEGQVFPPLMIVTYTDIFPFIPPRNSCICSQVTFAVEYEMDQKEAQIKTDTALGVMGGVAVLYALLKTVSWKRRIASPLIDATTLFKFLLFYAGDLANVFFAVTVGTGLYWLIFYKAQKFVSVLLPLPAQEERFVTYIGCAFALKAIQFLHKFFLQVSVDIFLIDWERPRSKSTAGESKRETSPVSIWRTYFVANEWNEIQTIRKISPSFQIMAVLFFLEVHTRTWYFPAPHRRTPLHTVIFFTVFHEHFVEDKIRQFVDLCSISNISVLLLSHRCYGYYIHGRSVHGHADTNMEEMNNNLKREAESLCGQRGLLPNTEIQTFQVSLTNRLRSQYDSIRDSIVRRNRPSRLIDASAANLSEPHFRAYHTMNHFLGSIIDHAHPDMDYIVKDKLMFERLIGMEFLEPSDKSIFYNDEAHSFSDVLFYGNEATLLIFDTLFFCVVDLGSQSFVLAAVLTYLQQTVFRILRNSLGRKNLVSKTLVDERFLI